MTQQALNRSRGAKTRAHDRRMRSDDAANHGYAERERERELVLGVLVMWFMISFDTRTDCFALPFANPNLQHPWGALRRDGGRHRGLDFPQARGTPIRVVADGVVVRRTWTDCLGNVVVIAHENGAFSAYAHMNKRSTRAEGTAVSRGDVVGFVGRSGSCATGPHLHITIAPTQDGFAHGETWDPYAYIRARETCSAPQEEVAMTDAKDERQPQDASRISLEQDYEVRYWTNALGCSEEELREAVRAVGHGADAVRQHLDAQRGAANP